ncbi:MAG TPA: methyltransferase [Fimbriimonadaceae bacterium]|nr:methyltransferase [Fimbriimonadaceae bacterium]
MLYELGLVGAFTVFLLAILHGAFTSHVGIERIVDDGHVLARIPDAAARPGERFPVYRYSRDWKSAIGEVEVERRDGDLTLCRYDPFAFRWPMGRHGVITAIDGRDISVNLGSNFGLVKGDTLIIFDGRTQVGRIFLMEVGKESSWAAQYPGGSELRPGMGVSEFLVPTQIVVFDNPVVGFIEVLLPCLLAAAYLFGWMRSKSSPLARVGSLLRGLALSMDRPAVRTGLALLLGWPAAWVSVRFCAEAIPYLLRAGWAAIVGWLHFDPGSSFDGIRALGDLLSDNAGILTLVVFAGYCWVLVARKKSPLGLAWESLRFRGGPVKGVKPGIGRDLLIWSLHLVIAYFFAYSLFSFLKGNLNAALDTAWPGAGVRVTGAFSPAQPGQIWDLFQSLVSTLGYMISHAPHFADGEAAWVTARYMLWSLTIGGCLVGYSHSILGYLWGKRIRNLDFTIPGWITNAVCYGPLLGVVVWQIAPPLQGADPIFASGPILHLDMATEFFLDVVYMLTIWNLGTMFGVMTDKGVRRTGFYGVVRHPSYTMEALMFIALELKGLSSGVNWLAAGVFLLLYWLRSEREDAFMSSSNPEYREYKQATPWKFLPGLY